MVRPTSDRLKEAVFSSLGARVPDAWILDACAGTGAIGIEALSRGAAGAVFVEPSPVAIACLQKNIATTRFEARSRVVALPWQQAAGVFAESATRFDVVYFDPPYCAPGFDEFLAAIIPFLADDARVLLEHPARMEVGPAQGFSVRKRLRAGGSAVTVLTRSIATPPPAKIGASEVEGE